jgi:hypothetical protein
MIAVFKTSVLYNFDIAILKPLLDKYLPIAKWNFDLADCDHILRIDNPIEITQTAIKLLQENNFDCEELY